ncbi:hypothetical protein [Mycobacterium sp.]|jgi:hypothetical protein|uniref:hypothetical protein n=1 Tax=Mycobacterium sp. TaxID=1785 RepID=UPI002C9E80B9|nr:hypothetical protein [Mycobacterium sp.]HXB85270.1 hypothetical protein [Mycobacterium sp.]
MTTPHPLADEPPAEHLTTPPPANAVGTASQQLPQPTTVDTTGLETMSQISDLQKQVAALQQQVAELQKLQPQVQMLLGHSHTTYGYTLGYVNLASIKLALDQGSDDYLVAIVSEGEASGNDVAYVGPPVTPPSNS